MVGVHATWHVSLSVVDQACVCLLDSVSNVASKVGLQISSLVSVFNSSGSTGGWE